ncbi:hypothetical protein LUZ60_008935 [Juncus effusus]|nr:hypothetical protein LUZ60_008935 [Juncus effusus]
MMGLLRSFMLKSQNIELLTRCIVSRRSCSLQNSTFPMRLHSFYFSSVFRTDYTALSRNLLAGPNETWVEKKNKGNRRRPSPPANCFSLFQENSEMEMEPIENASSISQDNSSNSPLPAAFLEFLEENGLDKSIYSLADSIPRYIRIKPGFETEISQIESELNCKLEKVSWLPGFYSVPSQIQIASSNAYQLGKIYGVDAASGAAVLALNAEPGDHILDLCAAPGAKLCMLSEMVGGSNGTVTGVDVARHRLAACRTMLRKYSLGDSCRLFVADGTSFNLLPVQSCEIEIDENLSGEKFEEWTGRKTKKERRRELKIRKNNPKLNSNSEPELIFYGINSGIVGLNKTELFNSSHLSDPCSSGYDKVLVDAECTHDGSIKHVQKFEKWGWKTMQKRVLDAERTDDLLNLQLKLLTNGFKLLKSGGILVYSTCSLTVRQNEDVVQRFLSVNPSAELREVEASKNWPCKPGKLPKTLRFDPTTSLTSGLFIAKLSKLG